MVIDVLLLRMHGLCSCLETSVRFLRGRFFCFIVFFYYFLCMNVLSLCCLSGVIKNNSVRASLSSSWTRWVWPVYKKAAVKRSRTCTLCGGRPLYDHIIIHNDVHDQSIIVHGCAWAAAVYSHTVVYIVRATTHVCIILCE